MAGRKNHKKTRHERKITQKKCIKISQRISGVDENNKVERGEK